MNPRFLQRMIDFFTVPQRDLRLYVNVLPALAQNAGIELLADLPARDAGADKIIEAVDWICCNVQAALARSEGGICL